MAVRTIPFDSGQEQGTDRSLLSGRFSLVRNGVLARDGQVRPRPAYTAIATTAYGSGSAVVYDLFNFNDRLAALGDVMGRGYPTDVLELVDGGAAVWRPTVLNPTFPRLPRATRVRDLPQPPDQQGGANTFSCAALGSVTCLVWNQAFGTETGFVQVVNADTGQVILLQNIAGKRLRVCALSDRFIIAGIDSGNANVTSWSFIPGTNETLQVLSATLLAVANLSQLTIEPVEDVGTQFVIAAMNTSGAIAVSRFTNAGVSQGAYTNIAAGLQAVAGSLSILASSAGDRIIVGALPSVRASLYTYDYSSGGASSGPFQVDAGDALGQSIVFDAVVPTCWVATTITDGSQIRTVYRSFNATAGTFDTSRTLFGLRLASELAIDDGDLFAAVRQGEDADSQSNQLVSWLPTDPKTLVTVASKDFEISTGQPSTNAPLPDLMKSSNGKLYWANASKAADEQVSPRVTEVDISSTARRQVCQVGAELYIGGGMPVVYDGLQLVECGFINRPVIHSVTGNGPGSLIEGAPYFYKLLWEALDADDNVTRSAVSTPFEWEADDTAADVVCETPISMRTNAGSANSGSVVRVKLYRTVATSELTPAVVTGNTVIDPPSASLDGLALLIYTETSNGGTTDLVTFDSGDTTAAAVLATINAELGTQATATLVAGALRITTDESGDHTHIRIIGGTALTILGLNFGQQSTGTSDINSGEVFHLCATEFTTFSGNIGEYITINDDMSDDDLREQQIVYTQAENPLDHHAPGPADLCASGGAGLIISGQPRADRWSVSKPFASSQGIQFANPGREKFSRRIRGVIEAVTQRDEERILFTRREVWAINGQGPARDGKGDFQSIRLVYGDGGLRPDGWRSVLHTEVGTFFQFDDNKLYLLSPGGELEWIGFPVVDTLETYPVVVAACYVRQLHTVCFALQDANGASGVLLRFDVRRKQWFEDDIGPIQALAEYQGRLAITLAGVVHVQNEQYGVGTTPTLTARLGSFTNWGSQGWGAITCFTLLARYRGPCTVEFQISYDDTRSWVTCGTYTLTNSDYDVDAPVELQFYPAQQECTRFAIQAIVTPTEVDSGAIWIIATDIHDDRDDGPARKGRSFTR